MPVGRLVMLRVTVRIWRTAEDSEDRVLMVNSMSLVGGVALLGFQFRNPGAEPVGMEVLGVV